MTLRRRLPNFASVIMAVAVAACDAAPEQSAVTRDTASVPAAQGVGPGTAALYGQPVLSYNINDEAREYAVFPDLPARNVLFRVMPARDDASTAGAYSTAGEYNETRVYDAQAKIMMVMVNLRR